MIVAEIHTNKGLMDFELYAGDTPKTVEHFRTLAEQGFYDGLLFFKYESDLLIQSGCPNNDGTGGCGYFIKDELDNKRKHDFGVISMAHTVENGNGSQFFLCLGRQGLESFDENNTCFGKLRDKGFDVIQKLRRGDQILKVVVDEIEDSA